jgi:KaiC/GvpD/RAD55 family RecA-like ATPase
MSSVPPEIHGLLNSEEGKFLLVKGEAGVGKTMFCLELIKEFGGLYVSTIVTAEQLYKDCPGLEDSIPKDFILDATIHTTPSSSKLKGMESDIDDSILREILYETTSEGASGPLPPLLSEIDAKCDVAQIPFCVIIDSWDSIFSLASFPKDDSGSEYWLRDEMQRALLNHFRKRNVNVVMVSEGDRDSRMDFLVDGVVSLSMERDMGRTLRLLKIRKIRGAEIEFPEYIFTLSRGNFRFFRHEVEPVEVDLEEWGPVEDEDGFFSTGCPDIDEVMGGGLPRGSTIMVELGNSVPNHMWETLISSITANFLIQNRSVMVVPMGGMNINKFESELYTYVGKEKFNTNVRIMERADTLGARDKPYIIPIRFEDITHDLREWQRVYMRLREKTGNPTLEIIGMDTQEARYGEDIYKEIISVSAEQAKREGNVILRLARPGLESINQRSRNISDIHIKIIERNGVTIVYGEKPVTRMYAVTVDSEDGNKRLALRPIV